MLDLPMALKAFNDIMRMLIPLVVELKALADDGDSEERAAIEADGAASIEKALGKQMDAALGAVRETDPGAIGGASAAVSAVDAQSEPLRVAVSRMLGEAVTLGVQSAQVGIEGRPQGTGGSHGGQPVLGVDWELINQEALLWARRYSYELVRDLDETTRHTLRTQIADWIEAREDLPALEARLAGTFGEGRARIISATEVTRAYAEGNRQALRATGLVSKYTWHTAADETVCPICVPKNGQAYSLDGEMPPAHVACRCWITPIF